jgi:hypothetical protein
MTAVLAPALVGGGLTACSTPPMPTGLVCSSGYHPSYNHLLKKWTCARNSTSSTSTSHRSKKKRT